MDGGGGIIALKKPFFLAKRDLAACVRVETRGGGEAA